MRRIQGGMTRRELGWMLAGAVPLGAMAQNPNAKKRKVLVAGGHPDDPETGCGGTILRYTDAGDEVVVVYLTRGQAGIPGTGLETAAKIRTAEAEKACALMKARPVFLSQVDGASELTPARYEEVRGVIEKEAPDVIFTHWPLDTHRDHRHCANLVLDAWMQLRRRQPLYYYEVATGGQTQTFLPTDHVDITATVDRKHAACFAHVSQKLTQVYDRDHGQMERFRGLEARSRFAEGFVRHAQGPRGMLP